MKRTTWLALAAVLPFAGILILHAGHYSPFISDDSLISLRYARRLLDGQGLTWTGGQPVEGYSNLLWILLVALAGRLGLDLVTAVRVLGVIGMATIMFSLAFWYLRTQILRIAWFPIALGLLFLALNAPIAVWAIGGLEQPLYGALISISIPLLYRVVGRGEPDYRGAVWLSFSLGLICLTRPDGPIFAAAGACSLVLAGWIERKPAPVRHALAALLIPALCVAGQAAFRAIYYGTLIPNTALVKIAPSSAHWTSGINYLSDGFRSLFPYLHLAVAAMAAMLLFHRSRAKGISLAAAAIAWSAYVAFIGGDVFPAFRQLIPLIVIFAFALAEGACFVAEALASRPAVFIPAAALALLPLIPYTRTQFADKWSQRALHERWEWQGQEVGLLLKQAFGAAQPLVAVTAAGAVPYWSGLPALDMMGLNDYYLPRHPPANFGSGMVGHELGDGPYVLSRQPDVIVFDVGSRQPSWRSGEELDKMPEFHARYVPVAVRTQPIEYPVVIYVDQESRRIGVTRSAASIAIPGFLFTGDGSLASLDANGRLVVSLDGTRTVQATVDADSQFHWSVDRTASPLDGIDADVRQEGRTVTVTLRPARAESSAPVEIAQVVLRARPPE